MSRGSSSRPASVGWSGAGPPAGISDKGRAGHPGASRAAAAAGVAWSGSWNRALGAQSAAMKPNSAGVSRQFIGTRIAPSRAQAKSSAIMSGVLKPR